MSDTRCLNYSNTLSLIIFKHIGTYMYKFILLMILLYVHCTSPLQIYNFGIIFTVQELI